MDPYSGIAKLIKDSNKNSSNIFIGEVINPRPNLKIRVNGIELNKNNLLLSESLANDTSDNKVLNVGNKVLIVKNNKIYVVVSKVVSP